MVVAGTTLLFSLFYNGVEAVMPLWVTKALGYSPHQWAQMRSLRFWGVFVGIVLLGALSDRFGQRFIGALCMIGSAGAMIAFWLGGNKVIWVLMPIHGALMSTAFVNMNTLTQQISHRRQGVANSIYRGIGAGAFIIAPAAATWLGTVWGGYPPVFGLGAGLLLASAMILFRYPGESVPPSLGNIREEFLRLGRGYLTALRQRELMWFIHINMIWGNVLAGVGTYFAIYFTNQRYLHQQDETYGLVMSLAGLMAFIATLAAGFFLDRLSLRKVHIVSGILSGVSSILLAINGSPWFAAAGFILFIMLTTALVGPTSMWVSRAAGASTQTAAFSVHKVFAALYVAVVMLLLGWLENIIGIRNIFLYGGIIGIVSALGFCLLREPPQPGVTIGRNGD